MKKNTKIVILILGITLLCVIGTFLILYQLSKPVNQKEVKSPSEAFFENAYIINTANNEVRFIYQYEEYQYKGKVKSDVVGVCDIEVIDGKIKKIYQKPEKGTAYIEAYEDTQITLDNGSIYACKEDMPIYQVRKDNIWQGERSDFIIGASKVDYVIAKGEICAILIYEEVVPETIRVVLKNQDKMVYEDLFVSADDTFRIEDDTFSKQNVVSMNDYEKKNQKGSYRVQSEFGLLYWNDCNDMEAHSSFEGEFLIKKTENGWIIINELPVETYVKYVLPSEMPSSFSFEALKAQAVCARTFAYSQMKNQTYAWIGANIDNTTAFQVYHSIQPTETTIKAVEDTKDEVLTYDDQLITCYYFSTCGSKTQTTLVWGNEDVPYLQSVESKDESSSFYTWKANVDLSKINDSSMGKVISIAAITTSDGGYVLDLEITFENGKKHIKNENEIRSFLGRGLQSLVLANGKERTDLAMLPSACFTIDKNKDAVTLTGSGFGHGVGMSQYGANELASEGKNYEEILTYYYQNAMLTNRSELW